MKEILVTDSLFIFAEHVEKLEKAGYKVTRLDKPEATEEELIEALQGKSGYILGGIEKVTNKVIEAADKLEVISFTGSDPYGFIVGHELATNKGIAITNSPGANAHAVSEFTVSIMLAMTRNLCELTRTGGKTFQTTQSLKELTVGIVGMGRIGMTVTKMLHGLGVKAVLYTGPNEKQNVDAEYFELDELLKRSNIVSLHAPVTAGKGFIGKRELALMKDGVLIVDCGFIGGIDVEALYPELKSGRLRGFQDSPAPEKFNDLPYDTWMHSNAHTAYNTHEATRNGSDMAVESIINILETGEDQYQVN